MVDNWIYDELYKEEWTRAVGIVKELSNKKKPKLKWASLDEKTGASYNIDGNRITVNSRLIKDEGGHGISCFRKIIRHEIAHVLSHGHGPDFEEICNNLGGVLSYTRVVKKNGK